MSEELYHNKITTSTADIEFIEEDIVCITYHNLRGNVEGDEAKENYDSALSIRNKEDDRLLVITAKEMLLSKEARQELLIGLKKWKKIAVVVHNLGQKIMGNFIIKLFLGHPFKTFSSKEEALEWLKENDR